jgi:trans-aconitate methyltransferase
MRSDYAQAYADLYRRHWWWQSRERIVFDQIGRLNLTEPIDILDVGCGAGVMLEQLSRYGRVSGIEVDTSMLTADTPFRNRIHTEPLGSDIYRDKQFDLITCLDVLEHIQGDSQAVIDMMNMLRPGGSLLVTVPAFMSLWDEHDTMNLHFRRYTKNHLHDLLSPHGELRDVRYLFAGLFAPKWFVRQINRWRQKKIEQAKLSPAIVNRAMRALCMAEYRCSSWMRLPFGTSVLAVLHKPRAVAMRKVA